LNFKSSIKKISIGGIYVRVYNIVMDIFGLQKGISLNQIQSGESLQDETESDSRVSQDIRKANRITVSENVSLLKEYYDLD